MKLNLIHRMVLVGILVLLGVMLVTIVQGEESVVIESIPMQETYTKAFCTEVNGLMHCEDKLVVVENGMETVSFSSAVTGFVVVPLE